MDTPVQNPERPGMPQIAPSGDPQPVGIEEPGVSSALSGGSGASFAESLLSGIPRPAYAPPNPEAVNPQAPAVPQPAPQPVQVPAVPPQPPAPTPEPAPQHVSLSDRYSNASAADPMATLEKLPELQPEQQVAAPQNMPDNANHAWAAIRAQASQYRRQAEEFRNKYNEVVDGARKFADERKAFEDRIAALEKERVSLQDDIGRMDLTRSVQFREQYDKPILEVQSDIARTLIDNGIDKEQAVRAAEQIVTSDRDDVPQLLSNLPTYAQGIVMVAFDKADKLYAQREHAISEWRQTQEGLDQSSTRGRVIADARHTLELANDAINLVRSLPESKGMVPAFQVTEPTFAADREQKVDQFKSWVQNAPEDQRMAAMFEGFMAPKTYEMLDQVMRENLQLKEALASRSRLVSPPVNSWTPPAVPTQPPPPPPQAPTVATDGYSMAGGPGGASEFLQQLMASQFAQK